MPDLTIERITDPGGDVILRAAGILDAKSAPTLMSRARAVSGEGSHLILNLHGITFIASSGVGSLLALVEDFTEAGLEVHFTELSSAVRSVIRLLNLDKFLQIHATEAAAMEARRKAA